MNYDTWKTTEPDYHTGDFPVCQNCECEMVRVNARGEWFCEECEPDETEAQSHR